MFSQVTINLFTGWGQVGFLSCPWSHAPSRGRVSLAPDPFGRGSPGPFKGGGAGRVYSGGHSGGRYVLY